MAEKGDPRVLRHLVVYLRMESGLTQAAFGKAARVDQGDMSRYELGKDAPPEKALRRMAEVPDVPWSVVVHLRRFYTAAIAAVDRWREQMGETAGEPQDSALVVESVLLAVTPYLVKTRPAEPRRKTLDEEQSEAEEVWAALERFPIPRRRRLLELAPPGHRTRALVERARRAGADAAAQNAEEAGDLAALARFTEERFETERA